MNGFANHPSPQLAESSPLGESDHPFCESRGSDRVFPPSGSVSSFRLFIIRLHYAGVYLIFVQICAYNYGMTIKGHHLGRPPMHGETQSARLYLRAMSEEKSAYEAAAEAAGISLSDWIRDRLNNAAQEELRAIIK